MQGVKPRTKAKTNKRPNDEKPDVRPGCLAVAFEILQTALLINSELIIMGTHARKGLKHLTLGSNTDKVVRHARCPVLVFPPQLRQPRLSMGRLAGIVQFLRLLPLALRPGRASDLATLKEWIRVRFPDVTRLSCSDLSRWLADITQPAPILLDVRSEKEFATSHIKGAIHTISIRELRKTPDIPLVIYCSVGYRAAQFARQLQHQGFTNVNVLEGGIFQWANEGRDLYRGTRLVYEVHPHSRKWRPLLNRPV